MKVRERPRTGEAIQWQPGMEIDGVETHGLGGIISPEVWNTMYAHPGRYGAIMVNHKWHLVHPGDWIVSIPGDQRTLHTDVQFRERYEVIEAARIR